MKFTLLILVTIGSLCAATAQSDPSSKVLKATLPGTWLVKTLFTPNYDKMDEEDLYWPIDDNNKDKFIWEEEAREDSRYYRSFGITTIEFLADGSFKGDHHKGKKVAGEWKYVAPKRKRVGYFYMMYQGNMDEDNIWIPKEEILDYTINFQQVELKGNELILTGDTCRDGCMLKLVLEKVE
ncbi:MAG: hypothetical protein RIF39_16980 [Cyclobacteriaceae bacterium]